MLDDALLDDPMALERADGDDALLALAGAGARVRTALRSADEAGLGRLQPEGRPRTVLVAGHGSALTAGDCLAALGGSGCPVLLLAPSGAAPAEDGTPRDVPGRVFAHSLGWQLPGWLGPLDLLVVASEDGAEPGLSELVEKAYLRGCSLVVIAPPGSRLAEAAVQARALPLPYVPYTGGAGALPGSWDTPSTRPAGAAPEPDLPAQDPGALWALLAPLLALAGRIGMAAIDNRSLQAAANRLDEVAVRCRPDAGAYRNPAKSLAAQLSGTLPLLWGDGPLTAAVARRFAALLADRAGLAALPGVLPQVLTEHRGLLAVRLGGGAEADDFFRDRVDEPDPLRLQALLLRRNPAAAPDADNDAPAPLEQSEADSDSGRLAPEDPDTAAVRRAVARARRLADKHGTALREISTARTDPVEALAELVGLTDFAAVYLGLAAAPGAS